MPGEFADIRPFLAVGAEIIRPPPDRNPGEWAEQNRILPHDSPEPGPFRVGRTPYMWPIYRAARSPFTRFITVVMGAQMGKTESMFNIIGARMDDNPTPCMYVAPTQKLVQSISDNRVMSMLRTAPGLWAKLAKGRHNKIAMKKIAGTPLYFAWAGSPTELASHPIGLALVDERDRMKSTDEGDPIDLVSARTKNYPRGLVIATSTPTIDGASPIWARYLEGTRRAWHWPCPHCGELFAPRLALLRWPKEGTPDSRSRAAIVACPHCGGEIESKNKTEINRAGEMRRILYDADSGEIRPDPGPEPDAPQHESYWVHGLCSPWMSFADIAYKLITAYSSFDPDRIQATINTQGGEVYRIDGDAPSADEIEKRRAPYAPGELPRGVQLITLGADVQQDGIYWGVFGWGFNVECWLLDCGYLNGDTEHDSVYLLLAGVMGRQYGGVPVHRSFVDSGYRAPEIYRFTRRHPGAAFPTKGHDRRAVPLQSAAVDVTAGGGKIKGGVQLWHIDTDHYKTQIHSKIRWPLGEPGGLHIHQQTPEEFGRQVLAETLLIKASGERVWVKKRRDNHYLDVFVNAFAAADSLGVASLQPLPERSNVPDDGHNPNSTFYDNSKGPFIR